MLPKMVSAWRPATAIIALLLSGTLAAQERLARAPVVMENLAREHIVDALVEAVQQSTVSAQTSAQITEIRYDVDDYVKAGDILLRFKDTSQRARVAEAEARFNEAQSEFDRLDAVFEKGAVSQSELDRAAANLKAATARLKEARDSLGYTVVRAPYAGIVTERHVQVGEMASPGTPLISGVSLEKLRVSSEVPQTLVNAVRGNNQATVIIPDQNERRVPVEDMTIYPYSDPKTHSFKLRAELPGGASGLFPGMYVKLALTTGKELRLLAPSRAVVRRSEVAAVYVVDDQGKVSFRQVRVGRSWSEDGMTEILAGLDEGERVALDPVEAGIVLKGQRAGGGS
ncbi:MAG: efflux RND transporter periplasmic adaptor subunit [Chromatiales bacterium]|nr:efflux RND transporter periplasmic adaptor subunit [Chromatiales bacterium]